MKIVRLFILSALLGLSQTIISQSQSVLNTKFLEAAALNKSDSVAYWLSQGANVNYCDSIGGCALTLSIINFNQELSKFLVEKGAYVDGFYCNSIPPILIAALEGNLRCCYLLYSKGADLKVKDSGNHTVYDYAYSKGYLRVAEFLLNPRKYDNTPTYDEYLVMYENSYLANDIDKAIEFANKALQRAAVELNGNHPQYANCLNRLGMLYYNQNLYNQAEPILIKALQIRKDVLGESHPDYATSANNLGMLYLDKGEYNKAEPLLRQALQIRKTALGENHSDYVASLNNLGVFYKEQSNFEKAEQFFQLVLDIRRRTVGDKSPYYALALNNLSSLYNDKGECQKAIDLLNEALLIEEETLGKEHPDYVNTLSNLALQYSNKGDYEHALTLQHQALRIKMKVFGKMHSSVMYSLINVGDIYKEMGDYQKTESYLLQAQDVCKNIFGFNHPYYASILDKLASLYKSLDNYKQAEEYYQLALQIRLDKKGELSSDFINSLINIGSLYIDLGEYQKSESFLLQAEVLCEKLFGINHPVYATILDNLASLYRNLENYDKAETMLVKALQVIKNIYGDKHPEYSASLNNLGVLYKDQWRFNQAEPLLKESLQIKKQVFGESHPVYAVSLGNLASLYDKQCDYSKAEALYLEGLRIIRKKYGEDNSHYCKLLNNLSGMYFFQNKFSLADSICSRTLDIAKRIYGVNHPYYANMLDNLCVLYLSQDEYNKVAPLLQQSYDVITKQVNSSFSFLSGQERDLFLNKYRVNFNANKSFAFDCYLQLRPSISTFAYDNELFTKGILLNTSRQIQQTITESGDTALLRTYETMKEKRRRINYLESQPVDKQAGLQELEEEANQLDKELTKKSQAYRQVQSDQRIRWQDVQRNLKADEAAVEFSGFSYFHKDWTDSIMYCALVLKKGMEHPVLIPLCEQKQLDSLLVGGGEMPDIIYARGTRIASYSDLSATQLKNGTKLYNLIWKPLEEQLRGVHTIYYSPSGSLHKVAFAALPVDSTHRLSERYDLHQLSSTRQIATASWSDKPEKISQTALYGGIRYDRTEQEIATLQHAVPNGDLALSRSFIPDSTTRGTTWNYLDGTRKEVESITSLLQSKQIHTSSYTGIAASEEAFKSLSNQNVQVLHIATHGFFNPIEQESPRELDRMMRTGEQKFRYVANPLLRSGLILAGANRTWKGEEPLPGVEDGILTAQEISEMNLPKTELVVLSACETGLGDIKGGEGVFGLQRAFKLAGVKTLIMSLWKVPDAETAEMMEKFYRHWLVEGMSKHDAFRSAQGEMRKRFPDEPKRWAGFVMVD